MSGQVTSLSPLTQLKKVLGGGQLPEELSSGLKLLVDGLRVPAQFSKAVQAVFAERAGFVVAEDPHRVARAAFNALVKKNQGGVALGVLKALPKTSESTGNQTRLLGGLRYLIDCLECDSYIQGTVSSELEDVVVASSLEEAFTFFEQPELEESSKKGVKVVTLEGDVVTWSSFYSLRHDGGLVQMKVRIDAAVKEIDEVKVLYSTEQAARESASAELQNLEVRERELHRLRQEAERRLRTLSGERGQAQGKLSAEQRQIQELTRDLSRSQGQVEEAQKVIVQLTNDHAAAQTRLAEWSNEETKVLHQQLVDVTAEISKIEEERRQLQQQATAAVRETETVRREIDSAGREREQSNLEARRLEVERENCIALISRDYGEEQSAAIVASIKDARPELLAMEMRNTLERDVRFLRERIGRDRDINVSALADYEGENARLNDLTSQGKDLAQARDLLLESLAKLENASRDRFLVTFNAVQAHFREVIPELFGGGEGELRLADPNSPLDSGVDLMVRPPGKKPKSIDLLSGGEKALTAVGLIFSMFMVRPSPLCVLDEVDAPLDEANVERFLAFVKKMTAKTQFLLITHNKRSMAAADSLVGVTQEQPGASKVISVSLEEAAQQAA